MAWKLVSDHGVASYASNYNVKTVFAVATIVSGVRNVHTWAFHWHSEHDLVPSLQVGGHFLAQ